MLDLPKDLEDAAREFAGNHRKFESFGWHDRPEDDQNWGIFYTHNRDSGLRALSNADAIDHEMAKFPEDAIAERHSHWAVGWIDGYALRVYRADGTITDAFRALHGISMVLADYPVLDDADHSRREYEGALENIEQEMRGILDEYDLTIGGRAPEPDPDAVAEQVFGWLWEHEQRELDPVDDGPAYPSREAVRRAMDALYERAEDPTERDYDPDEDRTP